MNKRNSESKKITIEVFHVQSPSGQPWDIGNTHYVEVPPEGIFDMFECTELTYHVNAEKELKTTLMLSPPPSSGAAERRRRRRLRSVASQHEYGSGAPQSGRRSRCPTTIRHRGRRRC